MFALSQRSEDKLAGVNPRLAVVVRRAIQLSSIDFGVSEGLRSLARQKQLVAEGKSQTMNSKHLSGSAVDLVVIVGGVAQWDIASYVKVADAMKSAAVELKVDIRWGAAWSVDNFTSFKGNASSAYNAYLLSKKVAGSKPFIDSPHFELV